MNSIFNDAIKVASLLGAGFGGAFAFYKWYKKGTIDDQKNLIDIINEYKEKNSDICILKFQQAVYTSYKIRLDYKYSRMLMDIGSSTF
jgi:hypothetical protein